MNLIPQFSLWAQLFNSLDHRYKKCCTYCQKYNPSADNFYFHLLYRQMSLGLFLNLTDHTFGNRAAANSYEVDDHKRKLIH